MEEDRELKIIEHRKLEEMKRRLRTTNPPPKSEKTDREVVEEMLYDRGDEVLNAAYEYYPKETESLVRQLAIMAREGKFDSIRVSSEAMKD
jgi:hypothetical protein